MKAKDSTETTDDRQCFVVFPSEIDELLVLTEQSEFDNYVARWTLYHYLLQRRMGAPHGEAISNAELAALYGQTYPTFNRS